jgi:hypothetical protein
MPLVPTASPPPARHRRSAARVLLLVGALLVVAACTGGDDDGGADSASGAEERAESSPPPSGPPEGLDVEPVDPESEVGPPLRSSGGRATISLADGRVFELDGIICGLSPEDTGRESILFNAARVESSPYLDVTRLDVGSGPIDSINLYVTADFESYELFLEASSLAGNNDTFLELDGEVIRADAVFLLGDEGGFVDPSSEGIRGTIEVRCREAVPTTEP